MIEPDDDDDEEQQGGKSLRRVHDLGVLGWKKKGWERGLVIFSFRNSSLG